MISNINNQKIEIREVHINQFPVDRIFISLEEDFHKKLFASLGNNNFEYFNNLYFNNKLNWNTYKNWKYKGSFIPLCFIVRISGTFSDFSIQEIEKNIIAYKGPSSSAIIQNPNLPLKECTRLLKIIAHLLGDGSVGGDLVVNCPTENNILNIEILLQNY